MEQRNRIRLIAVLAGVLLLLLAPPLVLEALVLSVSSRVGRHGGAEEIHAIFEAVKVEEQGALTVARTHGDTTLSDFRKTQEFQTARKATDEALRAAADLAPLAPHIAALVRTINEVRAAVPLDGILPAASIASQYARVRLLLSASHLALAASKSPGFAVSSSRAAALSGVAAEWANAGARVRTATATPTGAFVSVLDAQGALSAFNRARFHLWELESIPGGGSRGAEEERRVDPRRVLDPAAAISIDATEAAAQVSFVAKANTTLELPTSVADAADAAFNAHVAALHAVNSVEPDAGFELALVLGTACAIVFALGAVAFAGYAVISAARAGDGSATSKKGGSGTSAGARAAAVDHMVQAHHRVRTLMAHIVRYDCTDASACNISGPALSALESELRALVRPVAAAVAHVPRAALVGSVGTQGSLTTTTTGAAAADCPLSQLDAPPSLRPNVSILVLDLHALGDATPVGDGAKALPGRVKRVRTAVLAEVLRRGGLPVLCPTHRWCFAWNLSGADKGGIQAAVQCAISVLSAITVDYPATRCCVTTGSVALGSAGSPTYRMTVVAGDPVQLAPVALRVAKAHGASLVVDSTTYMNCSAQSYRARAIESVAPDETYQEDAGVVLYDMLSQLDAHDGRMLLWNEAFEQYHSKKVDDAKRALQEWANEEGSDRTVRRLLSLLELNPPQLVTVGEATERMFTTVVGAAP